MTWPSLNLLLQSILSGIFIGGLYGLIGLGLGLTWGLLRQINLAHFGLVFLGGYLSYQMATVWKMDPLLALVLVPPVFFAIGAGMQWVLSRFAITPFNSLLVTFGITVVIESAIQGIWTADYRRLESHYNAMKKIDYTPPLHFHTYPAPGPMTKSPEGDGALALTIFEEHTPFINQGEAANFVKTFNERAAAANLPDTHVEVQAAASYTAWQILEAGVRGANSLDDKKIAEYLRKTRIDTIQGRLRFDGRNNYGDDLMKIKQVQGGSWKVVWPTSFAAPGATLQMR